MRDTRPSVRAELVEALVFADKPFDRLRANGTWLVFK